MNASQQVDVTDPVQSGISDAQEANEQHVLSLSEARAHLWEYVNTTVVKAIQDNQPQIISIAASVGVGKTTALAEVVKTMLCDSENYTRILWLTASKRLRDETADTHFADPTGKHRWVKGVALRYGRSPDPSDEGYCVMNRKVTALARARQSTRMTCKQCLYKSRCKYLCARAKTYKKRLVIGTHESYAHKEASIDKFHVVIIDEAVEDTLVDIVKYTHNTFARWATRLKSDTDSEYHKLLRNVMSVICDIVTQTYFDDKQYQHMPLATILRGIYGMKKRVKELRRITLIQRIDRLDANESWSEASLPFAGMHELLTVIHDEMCKKHIIDSQCWFVPLKNIYQTENMHGNANADGNTIIHYSPRTELISAMKNRVTIFLDATPPLKLYELLFGHIQTYKVDAKQHTHVTLFKDNLYHLHGRHDGHKPDYRRFEMISVMLPKWCCEYRKPLIVTEQHLANDVRALVPKHTDVIHYGSVAARGSNSYADCDAIMLIGHFQRPPEETERFVRAIRSTSTDCQIYDADVCYFESRKCDVEASGYRNADGTPYIRKVTYAVDDDVREYAQYFYSSEIQQLIGRLRPSREELCGKPIPVMLLIGEPPKDLKIDDITKLDHWLDEHVSPEDTHSLHKIHSGNERTHTEAMDNISNALLMFRAEGRKITVSAIADWHKKNKCSGASRNTVSKHKKQNPDLWKTAQAD